MGRFCVSCGTQLPEQANHCPSCGQSVHPLSGGPITPGGRPTGLSQNVAGALAYITIFPAILLLVIDPYNRNTFVRFHAFQSLLLFLLIFVLHVVLTLMPFIGHAMMVVVD